MLKLKGVNDIYETDQEFTDMSMLRERTPQEIINTCWEEDNGIILDSDIYYLSEGMYFIICVN